MDKQLFNGVEITIDSDGYKSCNFEDYIKARNKSNKSWSEKSFCDWCDKHDIAAIG